MFEKTIGWKFDNSYSQLSETLFTHIKPVPVKSPKIILFNETLSNEIDLNFFNIDNKNKATIFSGNQLPKGSKTIAQAYAGHQFGHFTILGDGRAITIGEHITKKNERFDIQFKGSGKTPYSRNADGRAALGPMLREYIVSEAMHHLNIPTTRSLAVVETGEMVIREKYLRGAILTRVASSHIRVGTFQYALVSKNKDDLKNLFNYTVNRHYPHLKKTKSQAIELLRIVMDKQISLICNWMRVGFIHGVMNTDNMSISGETIDYGPCAFMDRYDPNTVFSSIDHYGRYAYLNQPYIAKWNLERFAETLLPLINEDNKKAISAATEVLNEFKTRYVNEWLNMMRKKLGLLGKDVNDEKLFLELLTWMHLNKVDYTNTFYELQKNPDTRSQIFREKDFLNWENKWKLRQNQNNNSLKKSIEIMQKSNPIIIPRNHLVEEALDDATENNNFAKMNELISTLKNPYKMNSIVAKYQSRKIPENKNYKTFCGT